MSNPLVPINTLMAPATLEPIFGRASAEVVVDFLVTSYAPFADSFPPLLGRVQRDGKGLMVTCQHALKVVFENAVSGIENVTIGVLFTQAFPQFPPQVAILLQGRQVILPGHPFIAANGAVRTALLDCGPNPRSMFDILASVITMTQSNCPLVTAANGCSILDSVASQPASQRQQQQSSAVPQQPTPSPPTPTATAAVDTTPEDPLTQALLAALLAQVKQLSEHYIAARDGFLGLEGGLLEATAKVEEELQRIEVYEQEADMLAAEHDRCRAVLQGYVREVGPLDGLLVAKGSDCIAPRNDLHEQALELLAAIHAHQDQLTALERALSRGGINTEQYLRYVSKVARDEFRSRALYHTVVNHLQRDSNERALLRTHRKGLGTIAAGGGEDAMLELVRTTLAANRYDPERASRSLALLTQ